MNLFDGKFDLVDAYYVDTNKYKIQGSYTDNTGTFSTYDAQVGDIIYLDGTFVGIPILRYKIVELHTGEYYASVLSATVEWDMVEGIEPTEPFGGMEGIIGAIHENGLTANITTSLTNGVNEVLISRARSYQTMLLATTSGGEVDLSEVHEKISTIEGKLDTEVVEKITNIEDKLSQVQLEWEDVYKLSFE